MDDDFIKALSFVAILFIGYVIYNVVIWIYNFMCSACTWLWNATINVAEWIGSATHIVWNWLGWLTNTAIVFLGGTWYLISAILIIGFIISAIISIKKQWHLRPSANTQTQYRNTYSYSSSSYSNSNHTSNNNHSTQSNTNNSNTNQSSSKQSSKRRSSTKQKSSRKKKARYTYNPPKKEDMTLDWALKILGFQSGHTPTQTELKKRFRKLANSFHPDKNSDDPETANEKFKEVNAATTFLKKELGYA